MTSTALPSSCGSSCTTLSRTHIKISTWSPKVSLTHLPILTLLQLALLKNISSSKFWPHVFCRDHHAVAGAFPRGTPPTSAVRAPVWWQHQHAAESLLERKPWSPSTVWVYQETAERHQPREVRPLNFVFSLLHNIPQNNPQNCFPCLSLEPTDVICLIRL